MKKDSVILVAEHDEKHFEMIRNGLLRAGFSNQMLRLANCRQAIDYLLKMSLQPERERESQEYVLFVDVDLPEVGGVEVLEKIKKDEQLSNIPVIVLTAVDDPHTIDRCYSVGCGTYIVKPAGNKDFEESIQSIGCFLSVVETTSIK